MKKSKRHEQLFTLIELLVVAAVIAILASLLLPALNSARGMARGIICINIERQQSQAYFSYTNDFAGYTPVFNNYIYWYNNATYCTLAGAQTKWETGYWSINMICPNATGAMKSQILWNGKYYYAISLSYGYTYYSSGGFASFKLERVLSPSCKICFADAVHWCIGDYASYYPDYYAKTGEVDSNLTTAYRHNNKSANLAFFDGHVERQSWRDVFNARNALYYPFNH